MDYGKRGEKFKITPFTDAVISSIFAGIFSVCLAVTNLKLGASVSKTIQSALLFFAGISAVGFFVLRILACSLGQKRKNKIAECNESRKNTKQEPVSIFTADGNMQAEMIISTLKENGIEAYGQDLGDAGFASVRYGMGRGINDRVAISCGSVLKRACFTGNKRARIIMFLYVFLYF